MFLYKLSEGTAARRRVYLHLVDATDGITPETGEAAGQPQVSANGAAFGNTTATLTAVGNGLYYVELTAAELGAVGFNAVRYKSVNTAEAQVLIQVISFDPYDSVRMGLTALPNAAAEAAGGLYTRGTGAGQINQDANGRIDARVVNMASAVISDSTYATGTGSLAFGTADSGTTTTMVDAARTEADTDYWKGCYLLFTSGNISGQVRQITAFDPATDTATFAPATTQAVGTNTYEILAAAAVDVRLWNGVLPNNLTSGRVDSIVGAYASGQAPLQPTTAGRTLDVTATGAAGIDWANVEGQGTAVNLSATTTNVVNTASALTTNNDKTGYAIGVGGIASTAFAAGAIDATAIAPDAVGASELGADAANEVADALLARNVAGGSSAGRLVKEALYTLRNKTAIAAGTLTVYGTDDITPAFTAAVTTAAGNPIDSIDPV